MNRVKEITRLKLEPGDALLVTLQPDVWRDGRIMGPSMRFIARVSEALRELVPGHRIYVIGRGVTLTAVNPAQAQLTALPVEPDQP
jgi:hypothetical protein